MSELNYLNLTILVLTPLLSLYGILFVEIQIETLIFAVVYYFFTGLGITAGYHRYWSHRSYDSSKLYQIILCCAGTGAMEGSIKWWSRHHRAHHRYTDTDKDPYSSKKGLFWTHVGWMICKENPKFYGKVDISDLNADPLVKFQHKNYLPLSFLFAFIFPTIVCWFGWNDFVGGFFFAGVTRLVFLHHATFCVNSLAHYLGEPTYDDKRSPRDHIITAFLTLGEVHHEFPSDYRNAIQFYQYDPTKWFIWISSLLGLTFNLKTFPKNEIEKGKLMMLEKKIGKQKKLLDWGPNESELPLFSWKEFKMKINQESKKWLVLFDKVYDVSELMDVHPGGKGFLNAGIGRDMTVAFDGGIYDHSNAARNWMAQFLVGKLTDEVPDEFKGRFS